ncbi:hypothetical protein F4805DRAFT_286405 [Annulohypoxylon moriforme]|nr:hypothetical protein F4805DRAFT_286405 [Annulohypoxylon moriforme]
MQFTSTLLTLVLTATSLAAPGVSPVPEAGLSERAPIPGFRVGWGQELQNHDETNHWVVWVDGESACPAAIELAVLTNSPCGQAFSLKGQVMTLADCSNNEPRSVHGSDGSRVLACGANGKKGTKITCHGDQHDIVQHGVCF